MLKSSSIFKRNGAHLVEKKDVWKKWTIHSQYLNVLNTLKKNLCVKLWACKLCEFNGKYSKKNYDNPNYFVSLMIFQTCKNTILRSVHSLGWLVWLWFYPCHNFWIQDFFSKSCKSKNHEFSMSDSSWSTTLVWLTNPLF
jgi:hypothetical protein